MANKNFDTFKEDLTFFKNFAQNTIDSNLIGINSYLESISSFYVQKSDPQSNTSYIKQANVTETYDTIKKTTYYNIKSLYENLIGINTNNNGLTNTILSINDLNKIVIDDDVLNILSNESNLDCNSVGVKNFYDIYQIFSVVDRGNNDIGTKILVNLYNLYSSLHADFASESLKPGPFNQDKQIKNLTERTIHSLLSELAGTNGFLYQQIPNYLNLNSALSHLDTKNNETISEVVDQMFGVHDDTDLFGESFLGNRDIEFGGPTGFPGIIFQLGTIESKLDQSVDEKKVKNNYSSSLCLDIGYDDNNEINILGEDNVPQEIYKSNVTAFVVDFGKKNQQIFKNINLNTSQFYSTEESIRTWVDLVNKSGTAVMTSNLFPILEKRSYTCTVTSMGNATIQPLSYFYLRNVPLFHGTYWITNVSHNLSPNTMSTDFTGVRQPIASKSDTRKALLSLLTEKSKQLKEDVEGLNRIVTEGTQDTEGTIKYEKSSNKLYGEFYQLLVTGTGYESFDGKTILGAYIYSITNENELTARNFGVIATLYNISSAYKNKFNLPNSVPTYMPFVAIGLMQTEAKKRDSRYILNDTKETLSLSSLIKNSGNGFTLNGSLSEYLDKISDYTYYITTTKIPKNTKVYNIQATQNGKPIENNNVDVEMISTSELKNQQNDNIKLSEINLFLDPKSKYKPNDNFPAISETRTLFDMFNSIGDTNKVIDGLNIEKSLVTNKKNEVATLFDWTTLNGNPSKTEDETKDKLQLKFLGSYGSGGSNNIAFFSTKNTNNFGDVDLDGFNFDLSAKTITDTIINTDQNSFNPTNVGNFTPVQKYPGLFNIILNAESQTYDDYNWYTSGNKLNGYLANRNKSVYYKNLNKPLSQYSIGEIRGFQKNTREGNGQLWATGKYQIVPVTLNDNLIKLAGLTNNDLYSPQNQDKLGMALLSSDVLNYINKKVPDNQENLHKAALSVARIWSSVGVPYPVQGKFKFVQFDEGYYSKDGSTIDTAKTKTSDVQAVLNHYRNTPASQLASVNTTSNSTATNNVMQSPRVIAIGDSIAVGIVKGYDNIEDVNSPQILSQVGKRLKVDSGTNKSLINLLKNTNTTFPNVKKVILSIGSNDLWELNNNSDAIECVNLIKKVFPKASYYICNGNYGWGNLTVTPTNTASYWQTKINNYINPFKFNGFTVIGDVSLCNNHPAKGDSLFNSFDSILNQLA